MISMVESAVHYCLWIPSALRTTEEYAGDIRNELCEDAGQMHVAHIVKDVSEMDTGQASLKVAGRSICLFVEVLSSSS